MAIELRDWQAENAAYEWKRECAKHGYTAIRLNHGAGLYSLRVLDKAGKILREFKIDDDPVDFGQLDLPSAR